MTHSDGKPKKNEDNDLLVPNSNRQRTSLDIDSDGSEEDVASDAGTDEEITDALGNTILASGSGAPE